MAARPTVADPKAGVVGGPEARFVADALGWPIFAGSETADIIRITRALVWGPLEQVRLVRRAAPGCAVAWRVDGLHLPLTDSDRRLIDSLDRIVAADDLIAHRLIAALDGPGANLSVIAPDATFAVDQVPGATPGVVTPSAVGVVTRGCDAGALLLTLHRLIRNGIAACAACGARSLASFDPPTRRYLDVGRCRCGSSPRPQAELVVNVRLAVTGAGAVPPVALVKWLELDERVDVVELGASPWQDLAEWFRECLAVVCVTSSIDLPTATSVAFQLGVPALVPDHIGGAHGPTTAIGTRTETDMFGRVSHLLDPIALDRELRRLVADPVGRTHAPTQVAVTDTIEAWKQLVGEMPAGKLEPLLPIGRRRTAGR